MSKLRIAIAQINSHVGAIDKNTTKIINATKKAAKEGADLVVFPELALVGYPPEDLLFHNSLYEAVDQALDKIINECEVNVIVGYPKKTEQGIFNALSVIGGGKIIATYYKQKLPNYDVFDEKRYFEAGNEPCVVGIKGIKFGIFICEDGWFAPVPAQAKKAGAQVLIQVNASPFSVGRIADRIKIAKTRVLETSLPIICSQLVGGQDELVFDGGSFVLDKDAKEICCAKFFKEDLIFVDVNKNGDLTCPIDLPVVAQTTEEQMYNALVLGVKDYLGKNNFKGALIGLSGGIDSALTLAIAVDALGAKNVEAVIMPSKYTANMSIEDAETIAKNLGVCVHTISIEPMCTSFANGLADIFKDTKPDITEENIQARARGVILMALSNKFGKLVLTTGNKSEMAVGYATLYGDMAGGFGVLKDVYKTLVYRLVAYRNSIKKVIPDRVITRPPSAELRDDQTDQDTLPDYEVLDLIVKYYLEDHLSAGEIIAKGFDDVVVSSVLKLVKNSEYKRRQAPIGVRLTGRAFGRDRRYPITCGG